MKSKTTLLAILIFCLSSGALSAQNIKDLDFLIGSWQVEETIYPGTDREYKEKGIRTCSYYLKDAFIKCEAQTTVSTSGKERSYVYFITWNHMDGFFHAVNLAHDFPRPGIQQWYLDKEKKLITYVTPKTCSVTGLSEALFLLKTQIRSSGRAGGVSTIRTRPGNKYSKMWQPGSSKA